MHSRGWILGGLLSIGQDPTDTSSTDINDCLRKAHVPIDEKGSVDWIRDAAAFNVRLDPYTPVAIAVPKTISHIQDAVKCGRDLGLKVSPKAGGHSYTGGGFGGESGHLIVQLDRMTDVKLDKDTNIATVDPGTRLGHMATEIYEQGNRSVSHGTCPRVGALGHLVSGGYGMSSHTHGLALDFVVGATVVLANGSAVNISLDENPDLFWAMRGAGPNFGIVAQWRLRTFEAPKDLTWFHVTLGWNQSTAADYLAAVEQYIKWKMPKALNFRIADYERGHPIAEGLYYGTERQMKDDLAEFTTISNGTLYLSEQVNWIDAIKHYAADNTLNGSTAHVPVDFFEPGPPDNFFAKSLTLDSLTGSVAQAFVDYWYGTALPVDRKWWFQIDAAGGIHSAYAHPDPIHGPTSFGHRDKAFIIQFYDAVATHQAYPKNGMSLLNDWVSNMTKALDSESGDDKRWGAYANYPDPTLSRDDAQRLYFGDNLEKLQRLKLEYDPEERFYFPHSIAPWGKKESSHELKL
ncbi:glucooligosaccharide oxidase [Apiospora sp. TS-2023a]